MSRRWTLRLAACLLAGAALMAGCAEKQEARQTLPSASSAAPSEEQLPPLGPATYPVPDTAREKTSEGALSFAEYYMSLGTEIGLGRAPAQSMLDLSTADCRLCRQVAASFAEDQAAGYTRSGSASTFEENGPALLNGDTADVGFVYSQSADRVIDANGGEVPGRAGAASGDLQSGMRLIWQDDLRCWLVSNLTVG